MKYSKIRSDFQSNSYSFVVDAYATLISPILTKIFLKTNVTPNGVTMMMMLSGLIGAALFCSNNILIKLLGMIFIHLWYILDCSDGEVARIKKIFSKFGKEMDYVAHLLNHPFFVISFIVSSISFYKININLGLIIGIIIITSNLINRNLIMLKDTYFRVIGNEKNEENKRANYKGFILTNLIVMPNFALIFSFLHIVDIIFKIKMGYYYMIFFTITSVVIIYISFIRFIFNIKNK